jgi:DNA-binding NtrC family response regulator
MNTRKEQALAGKAPPPSPEPPMILVVDDEAGFRDMLQWELSNRGMKVETAANGTEALQLASKTKFDVIITDITMPEMNGLKLLEEINQISPQTRVIVSTGFGLVDMAVHAMKNGAFDFVLKPYDLEHLMTRVRQAVEQLPRCEHCGRSPHE